MERRTAEPFLNAAYPDLRASASQGAMELNNLKQTLYMLTCCMGAAYHGPELPEKIQALVEEDEIRDTAIDISKNSFDPESWELMQEPSSSRTWPFFLPEAVLYYNQSLLRDLQGLSLSGEEHKTIHEAKNGDFTFSELNTQLDGSLLCKAACQPFINRCLQIFSKDIGLKTPVTAELLAQIWGNADPSDIQENPQGWFVDIHESLRQLGEINTGGPKAVDGRATLFIQ